MYELARYAVKSARSLTLVPVLVVTLFCGGCRPKHAPPAFIGDGIILLLRSGVTNAAVVVAKQSMSPEVVDYNWFLRSDGGTTFEATNPAVASGTVPDLAKTSDAAGIVCSDWFGFIWDETPPQSHRQRTPRGRTEDRRKHRNSLG